MITLNKSVQVLPPSVFGLIAALSLFWGFNWAVMKIVLEEMQPMHFRSWCLGLSAVALFGMARLNGLAWRVPKGCWPALILIAAFNLGAWNVLAVYGLSMMDSGRAAILAYTMPLWAMLFGFWVMKEAVTRRKLIGLGLGFAGMLLLLGGEIAVVGRAPMGALLMTGAAVAWAVGIVMIRRWPIDLPLISFSAWQMLLSFPMLLLGAIVFEQDSVAVTALSFWPMAGLIYNVLFAIIF